MLRALFKRLMRGRLSRNARRSSGYSLSAGEAEFASDEFLSELLKIDINNCNRKSPSVIKREFVDLPLALGGQRVQGWHCYKSSNKRVYVYMLATQDRNIMF